ncbi:type IIG restriction enzyme/methyltransferase [Hymenobacter guriensis]|uniref:site-specific DNA-methyltransferase (adenine-specific) n=1 Tax=Hymenobacter guriensis TaxID=2793065 RepID=A0ABS0L7Q5_9BACT|nr:Eco57I restriction-modification methylase domain-containing protein [Hymenobacter guriensis]MBG8556099.1 Eco57I restriction-modification methylase domain-containing protein [Hymenobacter guriensis]
MQYRALLPSQALDLAYRRQKVTRATLDAFETARHQLLPQLDAALDEADMVQPLSKFLSAVGLKDYYLNSHKKRDLVMRTGAATTDPFGILFELKHQKNKSEMVRKDNLNRKALHELLLYYFQERTSEQEALELRQLIITTGYEWFIFDAHEFHRVFWKNTELRNFFQKHKQGQTSAGDTAFFYKEVKKLLDKIDTQVSFTYFTLDARDDKNQRRNLGERGLLWLSKLFSAPHLLKEPFAQDANTLNRAFYEELLYLMGLEEVKDKGRKLIQRCAPERRQRGSLLENTLVQLRAEDMLRNLPAEELATYGDTPDQQAQEVALALCLTWVSRLLFLKLLEGQLRRYHAPHDAPFRFLDPSQLKEYDLLNRLFYRILNRPLQEREQPEAGLYPHVPYLNSSLFEPSALERVTLRISGLDDQIALPLLARGKASRSVLRQEAGAPAPLALTYLLRFLDAYDFASEGSEAVTTDDDRPLISAAVLGLIFEKINGYKDGSFYTPGFITMYMCRHTLRRAVVRHFNERYALAAETVADLRELLDDKPKKRPEFSTAFNELRVCDPAVGSGHFLVSALNELLAIKSELGLLLDDEGKRLRYTLTVARDELAVTSDEDDELFEYHARLDADGQRHVGKDHSRLQNALFREKRHLIEHCLYGVDLNPNSVRICRLRLWIELLKHAYYTPESQFRELETLPNLDLNVRAGNSLISRFPLQADLSEVFRKKDTSVAAYRRAFNQFFSARGREAKQELQDFLARLKDQFRVAVSIHDPLNKKLKELKGQLAQLEYSGLDLFGKKSRSPADRAVEQQRLQMLIDLTQEQLTEKREATLYRDAFEWRFEFPEILNHDGSFRGFDAVLGNPPYIRQEELALVFKNHLKTGYETAAGTADLYVYFYEQGLRLLAPGGELSFITNNKWLRAGYGQGLRRYLLHPERQLVELLDFGDLPVFPEATTYPNILSVRRAPTTSTIRVAELTTLPTDTNNFDDIVNIAAIKIPITSLDDNAWSTASMDTQHLLIKLQSTGKTLGEYVDGKSFNGIKSALGAAFIVNEQVRSELIAADPKSSDVIRPFLIGKDIKRYLQPKTSDYILLIDWKFELDKYPSIKKHLLQFEEALKNRSEVKAGNHPWFALERPRSEAKSEFTKHKIIYNAFQVKPAFTIDTASHFSNNATYIIPTADLYLLGCLNSKVVWFQTSQICISIRGGYQLLFDNFKNISIPTATPEQQSEIAALVEQVLAAKAADATADTAGLEQQIDTLVAALYGLTEDEIALLQ